MTTDINNIDEKRLQEDARIDAYLRGQMSEEKEQAFIQELKENPQLKERAIAIARLTKGLKQVGTARDKETTEALRNASEKEIKQIIDKTVDKPKAKVVTLRKVSYILSLAASLVFIFWIGIEYYDYRMTTALAAEYENAFETSLLARGAEITEVEQHLDSLFSNVKTKTDLKHTLAELQQCWELSTSDTYNDYTAYAAEIGWNLAIGYLKNNDKTKAKTVLTKLQEMNHEGTAVGDKVRELNRKL